MMIKKPSDIERVAYNAMFAADDVLAHVKDQKWAYALDCIEEAVDNLTYLRSLLEEKK